MSSGSIRNRCIVDFGVAQKSKGPWVADVLQSFKRYVGERILKIRKMLFSRIRNCLVKDTVDETVACVRVI